MPENTAMPIAWRISLPAPVAVTSGTTPMMNANEVIRMGRRRRRQASIAASIGDRPRSTPSAGEFDDQNGVLTGEPHQHDEADLRQHVVIRALQPHAHHGEQQAHGHDENDRQRQAQLSYCAERIRNTSITQMGNTNSAVLPALFC